MNTAWHYRKGEVSAEDACHLPDLDYFCLECHTLVIHKSGHQPCFAHQDGVAPECSLRVNWGSAGRVLPHLGDRNDAHKVGLAVVRAFCQCFDFSPLAANDPYLGADEVTRALLLTVHLGQEEWQPFRFASDQTDAYNVLSRLVSADLSSALRQILAACIKKTKQTDFQVMSERLRKAACKIKWALYFRGVGDRIPLGSPWIELPGSANLIYHPNKGRFGTRAGEVYRDIRYGASVELGPVGWRSHPLKLARLYQDANGVQRYEIISSNVEPKRLIVASHGETLIIYLDPSERAQLYVVPGAARTVGASRPTPQTTLVAPAPTPATVAEPPKPVPTPATVAAPPHPTLGPAPKALLRGHHTRCPRCECVLNIENVDRHARKCAKAHQTSAHHPASGQVRTSSSAPQNKNRRGKMKPARNYTFCPYCPSYMTVLASKLQEHLYLAHKRGANPGKNKRR